MSTARAQDLAEAKRQSERGDLGLSDVVIVNDRPIWEVADEVLDWLELEVTAPSRSPSSRLEAQG